MTIYYNQFLDNFEKNPTSLDNGLMINNVCHIYYTPTIEVPAPTTRPDGSPLVTGDLWYNPSEQIQGFYNGTYWVGNRIKNTIYRAATGTGNADNLSPNLPFGKLLIENINWKYTANGNNDNSNYVSFQLGYFTMDSASTVTNLGTLKDSKLATVGGTLLEISETINLAILTNQIRGFRVTATLTGSSNYRLYCETNIRPILN